MTSGQLTCNGLPAMDKVANAQKYVFDMDSDNLVWHHLNQALLQENQRPTLHLKYGKKDLSEVTANMRDSFAHVLRCLKVWYDVSPECLFLAINTMDSFLARMKVQPKHLACIAVSCFHLAMQLTGISTTKAASIEDVLNISQTQCTVADVTRMEEIILKKLDCDLSTINSLNFVSLFCTVYNLHKPIACPAIKREAILMKLEILACNYQCAEFKSSVLALTLFGCILEASYISAGIDAMELMLFVTSLQNLCMITDTDMLRCRQVTLSVLDYYNQQQQFPLSQKQRLIWKLSRRTLLQLKPTARITSVLPTIQEADLRKLSRNRHDSDSDGMGGSESSSEVMDVEEEMASIEDPADNYWEMLGLWRINTELEQ